MVKRLKCWRKQPHHRYFGNNWWKHKETEDTVSVSSKIHGVYNVHTPISHITHAIKADAMKLAKKYMEGHDSC